MSPTTMALLVVLPVLACAIVALYRTSAAHAPEGTDTEDEGRRARLFDSSV
jgi:hypothetical protein